jgi:hypothetical protein
MGDPSRRIRRHIRQLRATGLDCHFNAVDVMRPRIVHDNDTARPQRWRQHLVHEGAQYGTIRGTLDRHDCFESGAGQRPQYRHVLPKIPGRGIVHSLALGRSSKAARHRNVYARFVDELQALDGTAD